MFAKKKISVTVGPQLSFFLTTDLLFYKNDCGLFAVAYLFYLSEHLGFMGISLPILELGSDFYSVVQGGVFLNPVIRYRNQAHAEIIGLNQLSDDQWINHFGRFAPLPNNLREPLAMKYHGHQFQHYNPDIGDGRGFTFAQFILPSALRSVVDPSLDLKVHRQLFELGTKGSGQTPFSRRGDGRLTLKGAVRELLATDYLEKQKVLTSKTFSIVETDEKLQRNDEPSPTRSAVLFRLSRGHIRIGNFQYLYFHQNRENIFKLVLYSLMNFYPEIKIPFTEKETIEVFFNSVLIRLADLCASYMVAGFVHGVLNTDNMNISGESFDYGPYRFLPNYDPYFTAAYFDNDGLYCFGRQPPTFLWNLDQLRQALLFAQPDADLTFLEDRFSLYFNTFFSARFLKKLNLKPVTTTTLTNLFSNLAPDYYSQSDILPIDTSQVKLASIQELTTTDFFANTQALIESFFQDIQSDEIHGKHKVFEATFQEILKWSLHGKDNDYFSKQTLSQISANFTPIQSLTDQQIVVRSQTLLIDEIESIWNEISSKNNWTALHNRLSQTTQ